jgi:hypothetical protein
MKFLYINLNKISNNDFENILKNLNRLNISEQYLNDLSFCPNFIIFNDPETKQITYDNVNNGYLDYLKSNYNVIEIVDINDLSEYILSLNNQINQLF